MIVVCKIEIAAVLLQPACVNTGERLIVLKVGHYKKPKWCQFLENLHKYSLKYIGFNHAKQIMGYHACFLDILTNITHEIRDKTTYYHPLGLVSDYGGLPYHFMSKLYSNISKPSMVTPHLLCMDETNVLPGIFLEIFKKMTSLLFFCSDPP